MDLFSLLVPQFDGLRCGWPTRPRAWPVTQMHPCNWSYSSTCGVCTGSPFIDGNSVLRCLTPVRYAAPTRISECACLGREIRAINIVRGYARRCLDALGVQKFEQRRSFEVCDVRPPPTLTPTTNWQNNVSRAGSQPERGEGTPCQGILHFQR